MYPTRIPTLQTIPTLRLVTIIHTMWISRSELKHSHKPLPTPFSTSPDTLTELLH
jgi:hypothetical protein